MSRKRVRIIARCATALAVVLVAAACGSSGAGDAVPTADQPSSAVQSAVMPSASTTGGEASSSPSASNSPSASGVPTSGSSEPAPSEQISVAGKEIAFANLTDAGELTQTVKKGVQSAADTVGAKLTTYDNKFDATATLENAKLIALAKPDMVLEWNPVAATAKAVERAFSQEQISCIAVNTAGAGGCAWFNADTGQLCGESGQAMAKVANDKGWKGEDTTVVLVAAAQMGATPNLCLGTFYYELQQTMQGLDKIASPEAVTLTTTDIGKTGIQVDTGDGLRDSAYNGVKNTLQSIDKTRHIIVYTLSDDAALGSWQAVTEAGRQANALTGGLGGDAAALAQLRTNPSWVLEGDLFMGHWGEYLMAMAQAELNGVQTPDLTTSPTAVLTKDFAIDGTTVTPMSTFYEEGKDVSSSLPALIPITTGSIGATDGTKGNAYLADTGILQKFENVAGLK